MGVPSAICEARRATLVAQNGQGIHINTQEFTIISRYPWACRICAVKYLTVTPLHEHCYMINCECLLFDEASYLDEVNDARNGM